MNEDLVEIEKEINERKELATVDEKPAVPTIEFGKSEEQTVNPPAVVEKDKATELVESAFNQAIVNRVVENQDVQDELLNSADTVIHNKLNAIKARADQEDKETHFNNKKNACECFGYNETTTEKWAVNVMNFWHNIMTIIWMFIGFFTFAPITFVAKKITVIFKKSWIAVTIAIILYLFITVGIPLLTHFKK